MLFKGRIFRPWFLLLLLLILLFPVSVADRASPAGNPSPPEEAASFSDHLSLVIPLEDKDRGNVGHTSRRGSYMSAIYGKENILVLDMDTGQVLYQASVGEPLYRSQEIMASRMRHSR